MDEHTHNHGHDHGAVPGSKLLISIALNSTITIAQVAGGIVSGSLALLSDAMHNLSDALALIISWIANRLSQQKNTPGRTFGYKRAEIIAAMINSSSLLAIAVLLVIEGTGRILHPQPVGSFWVILLAGFSIVVNGICVALLHMDARHNMNIKTAYLHLFTDMMTSVAVLAGGILMQVAGIYWVDPLISILIALYLTYAGFGLLLDTLKVLMQFTPKGIHPEEIGTEIDAIPEVRNIHHLHIWQLNDRQIHLEAHIDFTQDMLLSRVQATLEHIRRLLLDKFGIGHVTLQPGLDCCKDPTLISSYERNDHQDHR